MILGSHVSCSGKEMMLGSVKEAISYGSNAFMFYTGAPQNTRRKSQDMYMHEEAILLMKEHNIDISNVIVHAPYIINLGNSVKSETFELAIEFLTKEIEKCEYLGIKTIVLHPGSHVGEGSEVGVKQIINGLNLILKPEYNISIAIETMSGKGSECGATFEEIAAIFEGVHLSDKLSVCLDTCHVHDAGYDIINDLEGVLAKFDEIIGLDKISVIHLNDSKNECGASKDRHANIGKGYIGFEALSRIMHHEKLAHIPKILETPFVKSNMTDNSFPPYKYEIDMLRVNAYNDTFIEEILNEYEG